MRKRRTGIVLAGAVMLLLIVLGMYAGIGFYYRTHFLEHATINGTDVSDLTAEEAKERLAASVENYTLTVKTREGKTETIRGEDIRYRLVADQEMLIRWRCRPPMTSRCCSMWRQSLTA